MTLHTILVHMTAETQRHAGHADIVRELLDGEVGLREASDNPWSPTDGWDEHRRRLEAVAARFRAD